MHNKKPFVYYWDDDENTKRIVVTDLDLDAHRIIKR